MLVQPLSGPNANLCVGRVHSIGELSDEIQARIPFGPGDRVAWPQNATTHAVSGALVLLALTSVLAYEPLDDIVSGDGDPDDGV
jgi:hypothetical protein